LEAARVAASSIFGRDFSDEKSTYAWNPRAPVRGLPSRTPPTHVIARIRIWYARC
jgi:hypothetical protein